jgi:DivIVA domain-containing protein
MEVTPKTLREVEFREKMRGYHPEDVDHFLEEVAVGVESLLERLRQAIERAQRAEASASDGGSDETLRKTLILAQRTADMAVQEAREQASRILGGAEQQAQAILADAEERGRRLLEDTLAESRVELGKLESQRAQTQKDVDGLQRWLEEHKAHLQQTLGEALAAVERGGFLWPPPSTRPVDLGTPAPPPAPPAPPVPAAVAPGPAAVEPAGNGVAGGDAAGRLAIDDQRTIDPDATAAFSPPPPPPAAPRPDLVPNIDVTDGPDDRALDDFFDDSDELMEDRRFGGRLRRRR